MNAASDFAKDYWWLGGIVASLLWLWGARQYADKSNSAGAVGWQSIAVILIVIVGGKAIAEKQWGGFAIAVLVFILELREIRRTFRRLQRRAE